MLGRHAPVLRLTGIATVLLALAACGQTGPLFLPDEGDPAPATAGGNPAGTRPAGTSPAVESSDADGTDVTDRDREESGRE